MIIKKINISHAYVLHDIHKKSFKKFWDSSSFKTLLSNPSIFGFLATKFSFSEFSFIPIGFVLGQRINYEIYSICVLEKYRNLKVGSRLLDSFIQSSKLPITIEVEKNNIVAINMYKKFSFEKICEKKNYYENNEDAIIMQLK